MADTLTYRVVSDTEKRAVIQVTNLSDGSGESANLKINVANLAYAASLVTLTAAGPVGSYFRIGETVRPNGNVTANAVVAAFDPSSLKLSLVSVNQPGAFVNAATLVGLTTNVTLIQSGALVSPNCRVMVQGLQWCVSDGKAVQLQWHGNSGGANSTTLYICSGSDHFNATMAPQHNIQNDANVADGNITATTINFANNDSYTVVFDLKKTSGYQALLKETNPNFGFVGVN